MSRPRRSIATKSYIQFVQSDSEDETFRDENRERSSQPYTSIDSRRSPESDMQVIQPLTESQIFQSQTSIEQRTAQLKAVEEEYAELQRKLSSLDQKRRRIARRIFEDQARLGIMRTLPQDILSIIFKCFVIEFQQSPWTLMHVNRKWRQAALQTCTIWSGIEIATYMWQKRGHNRSRDGREICSTEDQLRRALKRAGNASLDIKIFTGSPDKKWWTSKMNAQFTKVINLLERLGTNGGLRIARLELLERRSYTTHITLKEITLPHLRELQVRFGGTASLRHIASSATQLETLDISFMDLKSMDPSYAWWPTIRSLKFTGTYGGAGQGYPEALSNMLSKTRSLKHLELLRFYNSDDPPDLQLPRLLTLTTDAHIGVVQINAPLLTHLTLVRDNSYWRRTPDTFTEQIFPSLTHLDVEYISQRLRYFQAPALHTFVIRAPFNSFFNKSAARELWFDKNEKPNTLNPIVLHIIKTFIHQQALIEILSSMDAIEELHIQGITAKKWLFSYLGQPIKLPRSSSVTVDPNPSLDPNTDPLATNLSDSSELLEESDNLGFEQGQVQDDDNLDSESNPRWPLPHLKEVSFDISGHKQATEVKNVKNLRLAVKKCLKARKLAGLEIECVRLRVEENSGWVYLS